MSISLISQLVTSIIKSRRISYIAICNLSFLYIVCSEIFLTNNFLSSTTNGLLTVKYIFYTIVFLNLGFSIPVSTSSKKRLNLNLTNRKIRNIFKIFVLISLLYFILYFPKALESFKVGRLSAMEETYGQTNLLLTIVGNIPNCLVLITVYLYLKFPNAEIKKYLVLIFLLCVTPQILWGTRYPLLFSIVAPFILFINVKKLPLKYYSYIIILVIVMGGGVNYLKNNRDNIIRENTVNVNVVEKVAAFGSNEGVVNGTVHIFNYLDHSTLLYGEASAFPLYFWIPREIWENKPYQLSYWFVRTYGDGFSVVHSAAYGFWGELLIDFGYFSIFLIFIFGYVLKVIYSKFLLLLYDKPLKIILYFLIYPFLFIAVRSPQTAIISMSSIYIIYYLCSLIILKYNKN
nr:O-antigen ligase [Chryseobacterium indoltheticum]